MPLMAKRAERYGVSSFETLVIVSEDVEPEQKRKNSI
jgi:hypothetical protein